MHVMGVRGRRLGAVGRPIDPSGLFKMIGITFRVAANETFKISLQPPASTPVRTQNGYQTEATGPRFTILKGQYLITECSVNLRLAFGQFSLPSEAGMDIP